MKIAGIGTIRKQDAMSILTREGRKAVKTGLITTEELGQMYKLDQVEKHQRLESMAKLSGSLTNGFRTI